MESFEEEAITTSSYKPRIWKCYMDDTFPILDCENVDDFLQQHKQHPFTYFTMETEKDNKLTFLDTTVLREPDGHLTTQKLNKTRKPYNSAKPANKFKATAVLPYVKGLSEQLCCCLQQEGVCIVLKLETKLRSQLVQPKDTVDLAKQDGVVYMIPI